MGSLLSDIEGSVAEKWLVAKMWNEAADQWKRGLSAHGHNDPGKRGTLTFMSPPCPLTRGCTDTARGMRARIHIRARGHVCSLRGCPR